jgi:NADH-quinone oxidoreductase subunit M
MGFVTMGIFSGTAVGEQGALFQELSHGVISGALFLCVGVVYDRMHTREIVRYGGLANRMPKYALIFMVFTMASVGLPGTAGFVGEFLVLLGLFQVNTWVSALAASGLILGAAYALYLYRRVIFGKLVREDLFDILDLSAREIAIFAPLVVVTIWIGVYPSSILNPMHASVSKLLHDIQAAQAAAHTVSVAER